MGKNAFSFSSLLSSLVYFQSVVGLFSCVALYLKEDIYFPKQGSFNEKSLVRNPSDQK